MSNAGLHDRSGVSLGVEAAGPCTACCSVAITQQQSKVLTMLPPYCMQTSSWFQETSKIN